MDETNWWNRPEHDTGGHPAVTQPVLASATAGARAHGKRRRALRWAGGIAAATLLAVAGTAAGFGLSRTSPPPAGQGAVLSAALAATDGGAGAAPGARMRPRRAVAILRHLRGIHGEFTVRTRDGKFRELAFERGVVVAASATQVTVRAADGTTWTWTVTSHTVVVKNRAKTTAASLAAGDNVLAAGPQNGTVRDARLILVPSHEGGRQPGPASSAAPSPSAAA